MTDWACALVCAAALGACAQPQQNPGRVASDPGGAATGAGATSDSAWEIVLTVSGGFAGLSQRFTATSPAGTLVAEDERRNTSGTRMLSPAELDELGDLLAHVAPPPARTTPQKAEKGPAPSSCADCISYEITIRTRDALYDAIYDDLTLPGAPDAPLIERLVDLGRSSMTDPTTRNP